MTAGDGRDGRGMSGPGAVHHDHNHVRQLLAVTEARVSGQMGNARRFSLEDV